MERRSRLPAPARMIIAERDHALLARSFRIDDPMSLPDRVPRLIPDHRIETVAFQYQTEDPVDCACCGRDKNHWSGFVAVLEGGGHALLGKNCGEEKHNLDYTLQRRSFETLEKRQRALKRALDAQELIRPLVIALDKLPTDSTVQAIWRVADELSTALPHLWRWLLPADDKGAVPGELWATVKGRDTAAENARDARFDRKLDDLARRENLERTSENDRLLIECFGLASDPDADRTPIFAAIRKPIARYIGVPLITVVPDINWSIDELINAAEVAMKPLAGKRSEELKTPTLNRVATDLTTVIRRAIALIADINGARRFGEPGNIDGVLLAANKVFRSKGQFQRDRSYLVWKASKGNVRRIELAFPSEPVSHERFTEMLERLTGDDDARTSRLDASDELVGANRVAHTSASLTRPLHTTAGGRP